jgi:hypothetical protein
VNTISGFPGASHVSSIAERGTVDAAKLWRVAEGVELFLGIFQDESPVRKLLKNPPHPPQVFTSFALLKDLAKY